MLIELMLLLAAFLYIFYRWATAHYKFFKIRGIAYDKPFPLFGSMKSIVFRQKNIFDLVVDLYNKADSKVYGIFDQRNPLLLIRDPEIVKQIAIKDFDHFVNHRSIFGDNDDNLFASSLFLMKNDKWKDMRSTLSPVFTGSKMRNMFQLMNQVAENSVEHLKKLVAQSNTGADGLELDFKDFCTRFANDIIASTAFGLQVNSYEQPENEFFLMGKKVTNFTALQNVKFMLFGICKGLMKLLKVEVFDRKTSDFFMRLVLDAMKYRVEHNISRPDMINMLMEARGLIKSDNPKTHNREWTDVDIVGQCFLFFFAGFETTATVVSFTAHELMENPDIQQKLFEEIDEVAQELGDKPLSYEVLHGMKYMDMVISESLRKWPAAIALDRVCTKDFYYESADGERLLIKENESIWLPTAGFHRDPKYFEEPLKFMPERFSEENKGNIQPFTYFPFGLGPRNCIGSRFALMEAKSVLFYLIRDFRVLPAKKSTIPLELAAKGFQLIPKNGFWLKFAPRK